MDLICDKYYLSNDMSILSSETFIYNFLMFSLITARHIVLNCIELILKNEFHFLVIYVKVLLEMYINLYKQLVLLIVLHKYFMHFYYLCRDYS